MRECEIEVKLGGRPCHVLEWIKSALKGFETFVTQNPDWFRHLKSACQRTEFCKEVESIGKTLASHIYELDEPLIRAKGANMICPRRMAHGTYRAYRCIRQLTYSTDGRWQFSRAFFHPWTCAACAGMGAWVLPLWTRSGERSHACTEARLFAGNQNKRIQI